MDFTVPLPHLVHELLDCRATPLTTPSLRRGVSTSNSSPPTLVIPDNLVTLPPGRLLHHTADPDTGTPILDIHDHPNSRYNIAGRLGGRVTRELTVRWVDSERPGIGLSAPSEAPKVLNYPSDMHYLAEHLGLISHYILETSGRTGFMLARAKHPPRF